MSKKLCFACHFDNGTAVRLRVDLRDIRELDKEGIFAPDFECHHGELPPPNELDDWAVKTFADLSGRARREFTAFTPLGIMWRFAPGKKPQKVDLSPSQAKKQRHNPILMATVTRGSAWQTIDFTNGGRGVWKAVLSTTPTCIGITLFGPLPGDEELHAWLSPLLAIPGAIEAFRRWPCHAGGPIEIEFEHKP